MDVLNEIAEPTTPALRLAHIAQAHPHLAETIAQHPNAYPELVSWAQDVHSIKEAAAGHIVLAPEMAQRVVQGMRKPRVRLTERELDVLRLLGDGASNREIARTLFVTEATVKTHLVNLFAKLGVESRAKAVTHARETGLL